MRGGSRCGNCGATEQNTEILRCAQDDSVGLYEPISALTSLSILSSIDIMRTVSATDAKQRLAALLDAAQREPVVIRRQNRDVAVIMSAEEYERIRDLNAAEFQRFCDRVGAQAKARGMTKSALKKLLKG
jgi:antitoxin Phd